MMKYILILFFTFISFNCFADVNIYLQSDVVISPLQTENNCNKSFMEKVNAIEYYGRLEKKENNDVYCTQSGIVASIGVSNGRYSLVIDYYSKALVSYTNLIKVSVKVGDRINLGDLIGTMESNCSFLYCILDQKTYMTIDSYSENNLNVNVEKGVKIFSMADGLILKKEYDSSYGSFIEVENKYFNIRYKYLSVIFIKTKSDIFMGQLLGLSGMSGEVEKPMIGIEIQNKKDKNNFTWAFVVLP